jgi:hypothetical protein
MNTELNPWNRSSTVPGTQLAVCLWPTVGSAQRRRIRDIRVVRDRFETFVQVARS